MSRPSEARDEAQNGALDGGAELRYAGFIRNVMTGREGLTAKRIVEIVRGSGGTEPASLRGTGNIVFGATPDSIDDVTARIEHGIANVLGRHEPVLVRTIDHLRTAVAADVFENSRIDDVHERCVTYLQAPVCGLDLPLHSQRGDLVVFDVRGLDVYSVTRLVSGRATSPGPMLERLSGSQVTSRNWSTVEYVLAKQ